MKLISKFLLTGVIAFSLAGPALGGDKETLYDQLGGDSGVTAIVDGTFDRALADKRIGHTFSESNVERVKGLVVEQICNLADGGCEYTGVDMAKSHRGLELTSMHFHAFVEVMQKAMDEEEVPFTVQNQLLALLAPMHRDVVHPEKHPQFKRKKK